MHLHERKKYRKDNVSVSVSVIVRVPLDSDCILSSAEVIGFPEIKINNLIYDIVHVNILGL